MFRKHQTAMELDKVVDIPAKIMASYAMYNVQCTMFTLWRIMLTFLDAADDDVGDGVDDDDYFLVAASGVEKNITAL